LERVADLAQLRHAGIARVRRVERLDAGTTLALVSEFPRGARLSDVLAVAERDGLDLDINAALCLVRQLVPALAALHNAAPGIAHGTLSPERIIVTPHARVVVVEHVLGPAVEQMRLSRDELWRDLRILTPSASGPAPRLDQSADIAQLGGVALALVLGRQVRAEELDTLPELLAAARETTVLGRRELLAAPLRRWLLRALQLDPRGCFRSVADAQEGLEHVLSEEGGYIAAPMALETFLVRYHERAVLSVPSHTARPSQPASPAGEGARPTPTPTGGTTRPAQGPPAAPANTPPHLVTVQPQRGGQTRGSTASAAKPAADAGKRIDAATVASASEPAARAEELVTADDQTVDSDGSDAAPQPSFERLPERFAISIRPRRFTGERVALAVCAVVAIGEAAYIWTHKPAPAVLTTEGSLSIESQPSGATVTIDDRERGVTPLTLNLTTGPHIVALHTPTGARVVPVTIKPGIAHTHYVELAPATTTGAIEVQADPGTHVLLDGDSRGTAPLTIGDLQPGDHELVLQSRTGEIRQRVVVQAGVTTPVRLPVVATAPVATGPAPAPVAEQGWVAVDVPFEMQVLADGQAIGTTSTRRLPLAPGRHRLEIVSETLAFRTSATVDIVAGREARVPVQLPKAPVAINAIPWAEVWIDGQKAGETPIGRIDLTVGPHEILFKHPEFPEQRHAISVTAGELTRVSVEMRK
ncbi:MAG TPA: PEGA domain-containing protein, partial [Vicinamibacterales bacterium]|nr:PEGA domain-containing protein [Vicinamibacterales bacterium]